MCFRSCDHHQPLVLQDASVLCYSGSTLWLCMNNVFISFASIGFQTCFYKYLRVCLLDSHIIYRIVSPKLSRLQVSPIHISTSQLRYIYDSINLCECLKLKLWFWFELWQVSSRNREQLRALCKDSRKAQVGIILWHTWFFLSRHYVNVNTPRFLNTLTRVDDSGG